MTEPKNKDNPRASKFDTQLYSDQVEYAEAIDDGLVDEREAMMASKLAASQKQAKVSGAAGIRQLIEETKHEGADESGMGGLTADQELFKSKKIKDREDQYHLRRLDRGRLMSPERVDYFSKDRQYESQSDTNADSNQAGLPVKRTYQQIMMAQMDQNEEIDAAREAKKAQEQTGVDQSNVLTKRPKFSDFPPPD